MKEDKDQRRKGGRKERGTGCEWRKRRRRKGRLRVERERRRKKKG